jgi:glycosyltransferase involved in cell wall biosynthesis
MLYNHKIAFVIHGMGMGGAEKFLINVIHHFYNNGYTPVLIVLSEEKILINELNSKVKVVTVLKNSRLDLTISKRIKAVIDAEGIKTVFCINTYAYFLTKLGFLFDSSMQFYLSLHSTLPGTRKLYWQNLAYFRVVSKNDQLIYLCNNQRKYLQKTYYISNHNGSIINNGIDTNYFNPELFKDLDVTALRRKYNISPTDKVIIKVARLHAEKGHYDAIDALDILHTQFKKPAHLLFVGSGHPEYTLALKKHADEKKLGSYVHFTGSQSDVRPFYCIADVFTLTSYRTETFSLAALEAMAFYLPCSLTEIGGASEMTIEGVTGALSKPQNPRSMAASWNKILNSNMKGKRIRQYVLDNFTSEKMLDKYLQLIDAGGITKLVDVKLLNTR